MQLLHLVLLYDVSTTDTPSVKFARETMRRSAFRVKMCNGTLGPVIPIGRGSAQGLKTGCDSVNAYAETCLRIVRRGYSSTTEYIFHDTNPKASTFRFRTPYILPAITIVLLATTSTPTSTLLRKTTSFYLRSA